MPSYYYGKPLYGSFEQRAQQRADLDMPRMYPTSTANSRRKKVVKRRPASKVAQNQGNPLVKYAPSRMYNFRPMNIFVRPPVVGVKHRSHLMYSDIVPLTSTGAGVVGYYAFSANGLYDPNITGTGHQPMGFDQLMLLYEHYTVTKAKVTATFISDDSKQCGMVGIAISPDGTLPSSYTTLIENGLVAKAFINGGRGGVQGFANNNAVQVSMPFDIKAINGRAAPIVGDDLYRGDAASNPTEQTYIALFCSNLSNATVFPITVSVDIDYEATFTEPRKLAAS